MSPPRLFILLSSYNGAQFIAEQIDSIQRQTLNGWKLVVRDDGSTDETVAIVEAVAKRDPRIELLQDQRGNLGPVASFGALLEQALSAGADYVALADQDDIWRPGKLAGEFEILRAREGEVGGAKPLLVHSDLTVVGQDLRLIHGSFLAFQGLANEREWPLGRLLMQNFVTGCTTLFNRPLLQAAVPMPCVVMHDWWLALCSAALGEILYLPEATVLYRQHGRNALGAHGQRKALWRSLRSPVTWWRQAGALLGESVEQACELTKRVEREELGNATASHALQVLREFCSAFNHGGGLTRLRVLFRHRIRPRTFLPYPVRFYARVLLWSGASRPAPAAHQRGELRTEAPGQPGTGV